MIRAEGLTKYYDSQCVVQDVSFEIQDHEIVGFLGLNGAGKTTVLRMLSGILSPSSGTIEIDGQDLLIDPLSLRWRIGFLPERPPVYEDMQVDAYLEFAAKLRGKPADRIEDVIELTDLSSVRTQRVGTLSHGFRQRLGIAQAIVHDPALVILDEPINGLDPVQIKEMRELITRLKERHTVLVSSHILTEISQTCDRILVLQEGKLVFNGTEEELSSKMNVDVKEVVAFILGSEDKIKNLLDGSDFVSQWWPQATVEGGLQVQLTLKDVSSEALAAAVVGAELGLRSLTPVKNQLESLFIRLMGTEV
jgi:ABC-2 type transport system ATP-binding protein